MARNATLHVIPYRSDSDRRHGYAKAYLRQRFRDEFGGDHPPDWRVDTTFVAELQDAAERAVENGLAAGRASRPCRRRLSPSIPPPATSWPWSVAATISVCRSIAPAAAGGSPARRSSRSSTPPRSSAGCRPSRCFTGLNSIAPQGPEEWTPRNVQDDAPDELTLRAALIESNNRAAAALQQKVGTRPCCGSPRTLGLPDLPDVPSLALGTGLVTPLRSHRRLRGVSQRRHWPCAARHHARASTPTAAPRCSSPSSASAALPEVAFQMVSMLADVIDRGTGAPARALGVRFPVGGKTGTTNDFKDAWFVGFSSSVVAGVWVGFDQPATIARGRVRRARSAADLGRLHAACRADPAARRVRAARRPRRRAAVRDQLSQARRRLPAYTEVLQGGRCQIPDRLCAIHRGSIRQRFTRTVQGWVAELAAAFAAPLNGEDRAFDLFEKVPRAVIDLDRADEESGIDPPAGSKCHKTRTPAFRAAVHMLRRVAGSISFGRLHLRALQRRMDDVRRRFD